MNNNITLLSLLIRSAIKNEALTEEKKQLFTQDALAVLLKISKKHDISPIIASALIDNGIVTKDNEYYEALKKEQFTAIYRTRGLKYETERISALLENKKIPYVLLKGSVIRRYYPQDWLRTSCDIDILVPEAQVNDAVDAVIAEGYTIGPRDYHDIALYSESGVLLEMHYSLLENTDNLDNVLKDVWQHTVSTDTQLVKLTDAFLIFHVIAHMSYHFISGGCGLRSLIDLWIINNKMNISVESSKELLERAGIYKYALEMSALAAYIFGEAEETEITETLLLYIMSGGTYGVLDQKLAMTKSKQTQSSYVIKRLFPPLKMMAENHSVLKKAPILLPFFWIARLVASVFKGKTKRVAHEFKKAQGVTDAEVQSMAYIREKLGL